MRHSSIPRATPLLLLLLKVLDRRKTQLLLVVTANGGVNLELTVRLGRSRICGTLARYIVAKVRLTDDLRHSLEFFLLEPIVERCLRCQVLCCLLRMVICCLRLLLLREEVNFEHFRIVYGVELLLAGSHAKRV